MSGTPPVVAVIGANSITASTANLVATINPQGETGTWWFTYGTAELDAQTTAQTVTAVSTPQTVTATLDGLQTNAGYQFAVVCQTDAGTVTSAPATFTPGAPAVSTQVTATPAVSTPDFAFPFMFTDQGAAVVEQASYPEILSCVQAIVVCETGGCPDLPTFGRGVDPTFQNSPPSATALLSAIQTWEPRADETAVVNALDASGADWAIQLTGTVTGTGQ